MNYNIKLEQYVLSCMITHIECAEEVELLQEDDFCDTTNKDIYQGIKDLVRSHTSFDAMILLQYINKSVPTDALMFIAETQSLKSNWKGYVKQLKDLTLKRKLSALAEDIINSKATGEEISEIAEKEIFNLRELIQTEDFADLGEIISTTLESIEKQQGQVGFSGLETGFKGLDVLTDGLNKKEYILIGARPSMGKTAFALNIISNVISRGKKVALFSLEMSKEQVIKRLLLSESRISAEKVKRKQLYEKDFQKLAVVSSQMYKSNIYINDNALLSVPQMKSMCRKIKRSKGLDMVVIDYLQLIKSKASNRREQVEAVSRDLKAMAKELDVPIIVISSLSRASETRNIKKPILSDLRETGSIEFDADIIMFLHREYYYNREADPNLAELIIAKQRNGSLGIVDLNWIPECTLFTNIFEDSEKPEAIEGFTQVSF